jgi:predicted HAD superfamily phosphohydrolase YqeG
MGQNSLSVKPFEQLDLDFFGKIVLLDIDGTLVPDGKMDFGFVLEKIGELKKNNTVYLCTNTRRENRKAQIEKLLGVPFVSSKYKKPSRKIIKDLDKNKDIVVAGDKFLTDFVFAKRIGADFIWAKRKLSGQERAVIKIINFVDDVLHAVYKIFVH